MEITLRSPQLLSPADLLNKISEIGPLLAEHVPEERKNRRLSPAVMDTLRQAGFFKLFLPRSLGGLEADPVITARLVEAVSHYNAAAGWAMMVANTAIWWARYSSDKAINKIFSNGPDVIIAGAFHPPMKATRVKDGYLINGRSPLASNVHEAQWIFVSALVMEDGQPKFNNGIPQVIGVNMDAAKCQIIDTWHTIGMNATDSNDIAANDVFVPDDFSFPLMPSPPATGHYAGPLYRFPALGASIASLIIPVALAVARNAVEELKSLATKKVPFGSATTMKERGTVQRKLGMAEALVQSARAYLYHEIEDCWNKTLNEETVSLEQRARLLLSVTHANQSCAQAVELVYSAAGTSGIYTSNPLANYFTDAEVIKQHGFSNESRYETAAQVYLGIPPDLPVIMF